MLAPLQQAPKAHIHLPRHRKCLQIKPSSDPKGVGGEGGATSPSLAVGYLKLHCGDVHVYARA